MVPLLDEGITTVVVEAGREVAAVVEDKVPGTVLGNEVMTAGLAVLVEELCCDCCLHVLVCSLKHLVLWKYLSQALQIDGRDLVSKI